MAPWTQGGPASISEGDHTVLVFIAFHSVWQHGCGISPSRWHFPGVPSSPHSCLWFFDGGHLMHVKLFFTSPVIVDIHHPFLACWPVIRLCWRISTRVHRSFWIMLFVFLLLFSFRDSVCNLDTDHLHKLEISSPILWASFYSVSNVFLETKFWNFHEVQFVYFSLCCL
jgi:hypothetical protein